MQKPGDDIYNYFKVGIEVQDTEPIESALKRFKKEVMQREILSEVKKREYYEKPSERRRKARMAAIRKMRRKMKLQQEQEY